MTDTSDEIETLLADRYRALSPGTRLRMATTMFSTGKRMALAGVRAVGGEQSAAALRRQLLDRLYGDELPRDVKEEILARSPG